MKLGNGSMVWEPEGVGLQMYNILFDKRLAHRKLPKDFIENNGFTTSGDKYINLYYISYRFEICEDIKLLITETPPLFLNEAVLKRMATKEEFVTYKNSITN